MFLKLNVLCGVVVLLGFCAVGFADAKSDTKSGAITLKESASGPPDGAARIELGTKVKLVSQPFITDDFLSKAKVIDPGATLKNTGEKPVFVIFFIAFFDKDNRLLGCASDDYGDSDEGVGPGQQRPLNHCTLKLPPEMLAKVASFKATLYESDTKI